MGGSSLEKSSDDGFILEGARRAGIYILLGKNILNG